MDALMDELMDEVMDEWLDGDMVFLRSDLTNLSESHMSEWPSHFGTL